MARAFTALLLGTALISVTSGVTKKSCEEFGRGVSFTSTQAIGTWHLVRLEQSKDPGDAQCVQFSTVGEQERKDLASRIGKVVDVQWEKLALKMQIPCPSGQNNKTRDYYLECLDVPGSYRTLQMPMPSAKLETADFGRHPMRLKMVLDKYLAMMDCYHNFVFVMGKQPHIERVEPELKKLLEDNAANDY
ncbi:uncharacterized protein LOC126381192 [Pectinophora gossypiella]|uniref:uncharacterized protein LOC126381192 n=1 Tax=Pectinophora gossypiella TaxID=13191 RepID=UPI00214E33F2|nr:uncharacterized protein LOC126381192 [Pectinophora gossypiella]